ncbi:MAG: MFS transporter [Acetobacteraceae bacterium]
MATANVDPSSVETRASWVIAVVALIILAVAYGAPLITAVALKPIAVDLDTPRSAPALASSLAYLGAGLGGILMGYLTERIGIRIIVMFGAVMIAAGLAVSSLQGLEMLYLGHGVLMGLFGASCMFSPIMTYVSRWFDRRRGTAIALISSGQYIAGVVWPTMIQQAVAHLGWRQTMLIFAVLVAVIVVPLAAIFLRRPPEAPVASLAHHGPPPGTPVAGFSPNVALGLLCFAIFSCCMTMSMPMQHMVAFCSDIGIGPSHGAIMLSVLLGSAFLARQFWGWLSDRIGGLQTILFGSMAQAIAMSGFLMTQDEVGLFTVSAAFGLGYAGLIPAYILTVRAVYPVSEASWRVPVVMFAGLIGMAGGGWFAGVLYDHFGYYVPAFAAGVGFNLLNLAVILPMVLRQRSTGPGMVVSRA